MVGRRSPAPQGDGVPWGYDRRFGIDYRVLLTHPDRNTQNERKATQSNAKQRTQGKQNQRSRNNTIKPKTEHRGFRTQLETTNDRKPKPIPTSSRSHRNHQPWPIAYRYLVAGTGYLEALLQGIQVSTS